MGTMRFYSERRQQAQFQKFIGAKTMLHNIVMCCSGGTLAFLLFRRQSSAVQRKECYIQPLKICITIERASGQYLHIRNSIMSWRSYIIYISTVLA